MNENKNIKKNNTMDRLDRLDLRNLLTVTIDGEDAKDLDDAISLEKVKDGFKLYVHIADVAHYVKENSEEDERAKILGTSTYLTDKVIPMLDEKYSNDLCSLKPGEDKLTITCIIELDRTGDITNYDIVHTIINSNKKMTYKAVDLVLKGEKVYGYKLYETLISNMGRLAFLLGKRRFLKGALDFSLPEAKVIMKRGKPVEIEVRKKTVATNIIEEFMILANETIAEHFFWLEIPFIYRNHDKPDTVKLKNLNEFMKPLGYSVRGRHGKSYQVLLERIKNSKEENLIKPILLRTMQRAEYSSVCNGHFGLASKYYSHFTSPIRRYPDLLIHRIIKCYLSGNLTKSKMDYYNEILPSLALDCSVLERKAEEAERNDVKEKKAIYMKSFIGQRFEGTISFTFDKKGLFVALDNTVEGFVPLRKFPGEYVYVKDSFTYINKKTKKALSLGDRVLIEVLKVYEDKVDFKLIRKIERKAPRAKKQKRKKPAHSVKQKSKF